MSKLPHPKCRSFIKYQLSIDTNSYTCSSDIKMKLEEKCYLEQFFRDPMKYIVTFSVYLKEGERERERETQRQNSKNKKE